MIKYNYGYGDEFDIVEAKDQNEADEMAYEAWKENAENQAVYESVELTPEIEEDGCF